MIRLYISRADAMIRESETLTSGRVGLQCGFEFSSDWTGLGKTAVFVAGSVTKTAVVSGNNIVEVPWECLENSGVNLKVGVYGTNADEADMIVIPTVWCGIDMILKGTEVSGTESASVTPTLAQQVLANSQAAVSAVITNVTVDDSEAGIVGTPDVTITDTTGVGSRTLNFKFANLKGATGATGATGPAGTTNWSDLTGKPSTFPPSTHTHAWSAITDKPSTFTPSSHSHVMEDITDLPSIPNSADEITYGTSTVADALTSQSEAIETLDGYVTGVNSDVTSTSTNIKGYDNSGTFIVDNGSESFTFPIQKGMTYSFTATGNNRNRYGWASVQIVNGTSLLSHDNEGTSFTSPIDGYGFFYINSSKNETIANTFRLTKTTSGLVADVTSLSEQIETKQDKIPANKNLVSENISGYWTSNSEFENENWQSADSNKYRAVKVYVEAGTYTFSTTESFRYLRYYANGNTTSIGEDKTSFTITQNADGYVGLNFRKADSSVMTTEPKIQLEVGSTATEYAERHDGTYGINAGGSVTPVPTLAQFNAQSEQIETINDTLDHYFEDVAYATSTGAYVNATTGATASSSAYNRTDFVDISAYKKLKYARTAITSTTASGMAFYSSNVASAYISGVESVHGASSSSYEDYEVDVPTGAQYARFSIIAAKADEFYIKGSKRSVVEEIAEQSSEITTLQSKTTWKKAGEATGKDIFVEFPTECEEVMVIVFVNGTNGMSMTFPRDVLSDSRVWYDMGISSNYAEIQIYTYKAKLAFAYKGSTEYSSTSKIVVYYR